MNEDLPGDPMKLRHVIDVDSLKDDPVMLMGFKGIIGYLISSGILHVETEGGEFVDILDVVFELLMQKQLVLVNYGNAHDPTEWKIEPGPEFAPDGITMPFEINLN